MILKEYESLLKIDRSLICEGMYGPCGKEAEIISCRTRYSDPESNKDPVFCKFCEKEYNNYWDEMWNEYWSDRL